MSKKLKTPAAVDAAEGVESIKDSRDTTSKTYAGTESQLVDAKQLLAELFSEASRPSVRWLRMLTEAGKLPHVRLGHLIFYRRSAVQAALARLEGSRQISCDALVEVAGVKCVSKVGEIIQ